ncbi:large conductance mechanosensitive channel protein MscL [Agromyces marinus]|uniref:Large-conductance mechanosensitive channel n=1 Tax=Agromyces marinus TaxID=1389020 RepID=A0ABM8H4T0_9MICO|nr:large conductance mechanosensitive channel protein MscL [Agromyces marinus]UIP59250.1 Large-conductance mechanosensitive channel [Agromyces marinus]BDZ55738.1 large-conductance mechanosensitive channel [Agromyces marinus]
MLKGFREFILRGNVIDLAVAVVIGAAFTAVVNSIVANVFNPLIGALFRADSLDTAFILELPTTEGGVAEVKFGAVIGAVLTFLIVAAVVYFVFVLPVNLAKEHAEERRKAGEPAPEDPETELTVLAEIRDLLAAQRTAGSGDGDGDAREARRPE